MRTGTILVLRKAQQPGELLGGGKGFETSSAYHAWPHDGGYCFTVNDGRGIGQPTIHWLTAAEFSDQFREFARYV